MDIMLIYIAVVLFTCLITIIFGIVAVPIAYNNSKRRRKMYIVHITKKK